MLIEVHVDREACRGSGSCVRRAPATFMLDDDRKAVVVTDSTDPIDVIREAANVCPFFAIKLKEKSE